MISSSVNSGFQSRYQDFGGWYYYPEVVNYYNENITDNGATVGYFCDELITFANRTVVDLNDVIYGMPIYSMIADADEIKFLNRIEKLNVKYFLIPNEGSPFYPLYERLANSTVFGDLFINNPQFVILQSFKYATLYRYYSNYETLSFSEVLP